MYYILKKTKEIIGNKTLNFFAIAVIVLIIISLFSGPVPKSVKAQFSQDDQSGHGGGGDNTSDLMGLNQACTDGSVSINGACKGQNGSACGGDSDCASGSCWGTLGGLGNVPGGGICLGNNAPNPCTDIPSPNQQTVVNSHTCPDVPPNGDLAEYSWYHLVYKCTDPYSLGSPPFCEQVCDDGFVLSHQGNPATFYCQSLSGHDCNPLDSSTVPDATNALLCPGANAGLPGMTDSYLSASCDAGVPGQCQWSCAPGFTFDQHDDGTQSCDPPNVFGYAWSSNVGWIKMNRCDDLNNGAGGPPDGVADAGSCTAGNAQRPQPMFGVNISLIDSGWGVDNTYQFSGYAWSDHAGWIKFGNTSETPPSGASTGDYGYDVLVDIPTSTQQPGLFSGWGKALSGLAGSGFDGWFSLASDPNDSNGKYLSGNTSSPLRGVTYNQTNGRIVGFAWGGPVLGWVKFGDGTSNYPIVTYKASLAIPNAFDFILTSSTPTPNPIEKPKSGDPAKTANSIMTVTKTTNVSSQSVALTRTFTKKPIGATDSTLPTFSWLNSISSCSPQSAVNSSCATAPQLIISVSSSATAGDYTVEITGTADDGTTNHTQVTRTATFSFTVIENSDNQTVLATCAPVSQTSYYVNTPIKWTASISSTDSNGNSTSGLPSGDSLVWSGTNVTNQSSDANNSSAFTKTYSTTGVKTMKVSVLDSNALPLLSNVSCTPNITVLVKPNNNEF